MTSGSVSDGAEVMLLELSYLFKYADAFVQ